jgi:hypothetical protein
MDDVVSSEELCPHCGQPLPKSEQVPEPAAAEEPETDEARAEAMRKASQDTPFLLGI